MALTIVANDVYATEAGRAERSLRTDAMTAANATNLAQDRYLFSDQQGRLATLGRGSDGVTTYLTLFSPNGTRRFLTIDNANAVAASASAP